jgi:hypothetical protein
VGSLTPPRQRHNPDRPVGASSRHH